MIKIGVVGAGHLGKIHIRLLKEIENCEFIGFHDIDQKVSQSVANEFGVKSFNDFNELLIECDAVDIVTPTLSHHYYATKALRRGKHVFIEKPIATTIDEAKEIEQLASEIKAKVQIGHVERFNPAFTAALPYVHNPMFIETHRLAQFNPRGTDVSVILDLMIHDLDIVLNVVKANIRKISASGVAVVSETPDIANARIEFDNGCVANLTSSRLSLKNMRKTRLFQRDAYISIDFLEKEAHVVMMKQVEGEADPLSITVELGGDKGLKEIFFENPKVNANNAIKDELTSFMEAIAENKDPKVTAGDGLKALDVAYKIIDKLSTSPNLMA
ncbi:MAG: Gfo/Idh/MocA family protein [Flavobacteriales bacterium]